MNMDKVAVLIPCYNEEKTIEKVVKDFKREENTITIILEPYSRYEDTL